jgi:hypothetical protein
VRTNALQNDGTWPRVAEWLESLASGPFRLPVGDHSPIAGRAADGALILFDPTTGTAVDECPIGDWVILGPDGFTAEHFDEPMES